jgi:Cellulase (glycosyl hydrolase family 5)
MLVALAALIGLGLILLNKVPRNYPPVASPIPPPDLHNSSPGSLDGFESPYLGHTGSWDGKGGSMWGGSKIPDLEVERAMGLRWTFMEVNWRAMEPKGPAVLDQAIPAPWKELDGFVIAAKERGLNILMQAPVVGGNAGGPPDWAGRREPGRSAPLNMDAAAEFAAKLAARYCPGGTLAARLGWSTNFGVRAWELDNEPEGYRTSWKGQAADYAEFVTKVAARIKQIDPQALILTPAISGGGNGGSWVEDALDASRLAGSPTFRQHGLPFSIGKSTDVVSFHSYEGLDTAFSRDERTVERVFSEIRARFERWESQPPEFAYPRKEDYWHTEGNYDFLGVMSAERRAAWRIQFFTRGFAAGIRKLAVMDACPREQIAVGNYIRVLPNPFPMLPANKEISVLQGQVAAFRHPDRPEPGAGQVWVIWALANTGDAIIEIPTRQSHLEATSVDGQRRVLEPINGRVRLDLRGDAKMAPPVLLVDRPAH